MSDAEITTRYEVRDAENRVIAVHCRTDTEDGEKKLRWEMPDGRTGLNGAPLSALPLYGAHLVNGWPVDDLVVLVEGEKAAQALLDAGLKAVGTVTGAGGTPGPEALEVLRDRRVVLWPDNDDPGRRHLECIAENVMEVAAEILIYAWDEAPEKGDAADHPAVVSRKAKAADRLLTDLEGSPRWRLVQWAVPDVHAGANGQQETITAAHLMLLDLPPVRYIVPDIVPEGVILLAGKPKLGKSWMALGLGVAVATGGVALGARRVAQGEVLYLALEDNRRRLQKRLGSLLSHGTGPEGLHIALDWRRLNEGGAEMIDDWLAARHDPRLVVVDTLKKVRPRSYGNRSVYEVDYEALESLVPVAAEHGVAILVVHHSRKSGADDPLDEISGSTGLTGGVDGAMILRRERGRADAFLHVTGRDIEDDIELALRWNRDTPGLTIVGDADEYRLSEERAEILGILEEDDDWMTPTKVAGILDKNPNAVKQRLWRMAKDGQVANQGGRYSVIRNRDNPIT